MQETIYEGAPLRLVWIDPQIGIPNYGSFLFNTPQEAVTTKRAILSNHPSYEVWLEDRAGNQIELPLASGGAGHSASK